MIGKSEVSKALDGAFRAAFMLTGSMEAAEHAVLIEWYLRNRVLQRWR
jgi:hypothetical protein